MSIGGHLVAWQGNLRGNYFDEVTTDIRRTVAVLSKSGVWTSVDLCTELAVQPSRLVNVATSLMR